jgi:DNA-binding LytR/AlgR family response regulator
VESNKVGARYLMSRSLQKRSLGPRVNAPLQRLPTKNLRETSPPADEQAHIGEEQDLSRTESDRKFFGSQDFVFLSDNVRCWVVRASDILTLEACGNYTRVTLSGATALIRRPLRECEGRLDPASFFRTRRDCIVNLSRVKQMRMLDSKRFLFVLLDGKEVPMSRKQSLLFRKQKAL